MEGAAGDQSQILEVLVITGHASSIQSIPSRILTPILKKLMAQSSSSSLFHTHVRSPSVRLGQLINIPLFRLDSYIHLAESTDKLPPPYSWCRNKTILPRHAQKCCSDTHTGATVGYELHICLSCNYSEGRLLPEQHFGLVVVHLSRFL